MKKLCFLLWFTLLTLTFPSKIRASQTALGIHLLDANELEQARDLVEGSDEAPGAVTVVLRADDRDVEKWQRFLDLSHEYRIIPIIRLASETLNGGWRQPNKKDLVEHARFLSSLDWHDEQLRVVIFNEPNHAADWGGKLDPQAYATLLDFAVDWFHTESKNYLVLPAGLDAAAPNSSGSMESFAFINTMFSGNHELLDKIDAWVSHAYPNPGFVGSPYDRGKRSIRGYEEELKFLSRFSPRKLDIYLTETGWKKTSYNLGNLPNYYIYAVKKVWTDERIKAITPFVFSAQKGPYKDFSFIQDSGIPTLHYLAWKAVRQAEKKAVF